MTFPERLKQIREEWGFSQAKLAKISGIGASSICGYEAGKIDPSSFAICCLADALKVSTDYLLGRTN